MSYNVELQQAIASNSNLPSRREVELAEQLRVTREQLEGVSRVVRAVQASAIVSEKQARSLGNSEAGGRRSDQPCASSAAIHGRPTTGACGGSDPAYPNEVCRFPLNHDGPCIDTASVEG